MTTYLLIAEEGETRYLQPLVQEKPDIKIMITGMGRAHTISTLSQWLKEGLIKPDDTLINVGYCGANGYHKGDVVSVEKVGHLTPMKFIPEPPIPLNKTLSDSVAECLTADDFVHKETAPTIRCVVDMELYYIALMFPHVLSIKIVSDEFDYDDYKQADFKESWKKVKEIIEKFV